MQAEQEFRRFGQYEIDQLRRHGIVNPEEAAEQINRIGSRGVILAFNHFSLMDGPNAALASENLFPDRQILMPVTKYLQKPAEILNTLKHNRFILQPIVTHSISQRMDQYRDSERAGFVDYMRRSIDLLHKNQAVAVFPSASRRKGGMGELEDTDRVMASLLRGSERYKPWVLPVGLSSRITAMKPEQLYNIHLTPYNIRVGEARNTTDLQELLVQQLKSAGPETDDQDIQGKLRKWEGIDPVIYEMIRDLVPDPYK